MDTRSHEEASATMGMWNDGFDTTPIDFVLVAGGVITKSSLLTGLLSAPASTRQNETGNSEKEPDHWNRR